MHASHLEVRRFVSLAGGSIDMSELVTPTAPKEEMMMTKDDTSSSLDIEVEMEDND